MTIPTNNGSGQQSRWQQHHRQRSSPHLLAACLLAMCSNTGASVVRLCRRHHVMWCLSKATGIVSRTVAITSPSGGHYIRSVYLHCCRRKSSSARRSLRQVLVMACITLLTLLLMSLYLIVDSSLLTREKSSTIEEAGGDVQGDSAHLIRSNAAGQKEYIDRHGVHVIVGQYMGRGFPWDPKPNLTSDILNANHYSPMLQMGENGSPVYVPDYERSRARDLFFVNRFNLVASDMISVNRSLPDPRRAACRAKHYEVTSLPDTSVIIVFHNEAWSTLLRTVHSVVNRSPRALLREIILVDDASERTFLGDDLTTYMQGLSAQSKVQIEILRSAHRIGLIRARIAGAERARGKVLTFLDAHVETTVGWLEPLLHRIAEQPTAVVCPVIDIINDQTFAYSRSFDSHWGAINWGLSFRWFSVGGRELRKMRRRNYDQTATYRSPIMAGGLFSISRRYFFQMGTYDSALQIWGGENIEMSLRVWQCGGRVEIAPCSHVAHLFRSSSPYSFGSSGTQVGDVLYANLVRVAEVWLDEWKHFFYGLNPAAAAIVRHDANRTRVLANISERHELRSRLRCKSFEWFLDNVWPESFFPTSTRHAVAIESALTQDCLQKPSSGRNPTGKVITAKCAIELYGPQLFVAPLPDTEGPIATDESVCLDVNSSTEHSPVLLIACAELDRQRWRYRPDTRQLVHVKSSLCMTLDKRGTFLSLRKCRDGGASLKQQWNMVPKKWKPDEK